MDNVEREAVVRWLRSHPGTEETRTTEPAIPVTRSNGCITDFGQPARDIRTIRYIMPQELADAIERGDHISSEGRE